MDFRRITPVFYVAPQIAPDDMDTIRTAGITRIICNRPNEEVPPDLRSAVMSDAAHAAGLEFEFRPLTHQTMTPEVIADNCARIEQSAGPVLAYCASGTRSTIAWALAAARDMHADDIIAAAAGAGYDLRNLRPTLQAIAAGP